MSAHPFTLTWWWYIARIVATIFASESTFMPAKPE